MRLRAVVLVLLMAGCARPAPPSLEGAPADETAPVLADLAWTTLAPDPAPRYEIALARVGSVVYEIGGLFAGAQASAVVERYDLATDTWSPAPPYPFAAHHLAAVAVDADSAPDNGTVYAFGSWVGIGQSASPLAYALAPGANAWTPLDPMPRARGAHAAGVLDGKIYLVGGTGADGGLLAEVDVYDPATGTWSQAAPLPAARDHLAVAVLDGLLYAYGGRERTLDTTVSDGFVYDPAADAWSPVPPMSQVRGGFAFVAWRGLLVAAGGEQGGSPRLLDSAEAYDPANGTWTPLPPMARPRTGLGGTVYGDRVVVVSGADGSGVPNSDAPEAFGPSPSSSSTRR